MALSLESAVGAFGAVAKEKLGNPAAKGQPEDQLRGPFENFLHDIAELLDLPRAAVVAVGEASLSDLRTRPDYAVTVRNALVGHVELKAPGKGADPRKFREPHDKDQWQRLRALPNLIYTDGNEFSLWRDGELAGMIVRLVGDIESSGRHLRAPFGLLGLFEKFLSWEPIAPRSAQELAHVSARLCRLLRDEVTEQLALGCAALTTLARDWRKLLFPEASDEQFADGYAQAVTFGLLMARAKDIELATGFHTIAEELGKTSSLIGAALDLLTENAANRAVLKTSLETLIRVLDAVQWPAIGKGDPEAWLYFYEEFLGVYDNELRKQTGSYYTPPDVVKAMVRLVDEELRGPRFGLFGGIAASSVTLADPATGTGTFPLEILRRIAKTVADDQGEGAVKGAINDAIKRLIAFEIQLGPFAVAQLRILAEIVELTGAPPATQPRMYVTDTLGNPEDEGGWIPGMLAPIASSRKDANKIKREEPITVVVGNPPYRERAKGLGGWVEGQGRDAELSAPLGAWIPPADWGVSAHAKHLRNLYIYFWRWATWKVFDQSPASRSGVVCFITVAGFLNGPGFQRMRDYLRRTCDEVWVIDCSPEGHQPAVNTRIFEAVQQPVCIVLASRGAGLDRETPARVRFRALPAGSREEKFEALLGITLECDGWADCPSDWRAPFLPASTGSWSAYAELEQLFVYNGSGVMPGRTWVIAPDKESLERRWQRLVTARPEEKEDLFHPHLVRGKPRDRHVARVLSSSLPGFPARPGAIAAEDGGCLPPVPYAFRSFDRQWIIPDNRVINQPNPELWELRSDRQVYLTVLSRISPTSGPAVTVAAVVPDLDHYKGRGGRVIPMWRDRAAATPNVRAGLLAALTQRYGSPVGAEDVFAYIVSIAAHPAFTARFAKDLTTPGLRVPFTAEDQTFRKAVEIGRRVVWLQTFGERMADPAAGRPLQPPRLPEERRPRIPHDGAIPAESALMPDSIDYDAVLHRLLIGTGFIDNVPPEVWRYNVSGKQVLRQWFSYRKANRERPIIGERRRPSPLGDIQPDHWLPEYTTELINVLNVLGLLIELESKQAQLLEEICTGPTITAEEFRTAGAFDGVAQPKRVRRQPQGPKLFD